jgi:BNR repeat-containing family member
MTKKIYNLLLICAVFLLISIENKAQNLKVDGYKGIWFTLGQVSEFGDKYSGGLATYTANHLPIAVYAAKAKKTFFVYGGTTKKDEKHLLIMISYFDHRKKCVPKPVIVYDKMGVDDPHDNASLAIDSSGFIFVFVSGRNTTRPGFIFKSQKPYNIDAFDQVREAEITYPQPWITKNSGFINMFTKYTNGRELYSSTSADGKKWTEDKKIAGMGGHYQITNMRGNTLVTAFNYHPKGDVNKRTNLYAMKTDDMGKTWQTIGGDSLQMPLTDPSSKALVKDYEDEGKLVFLNDLNFDANGNPIILAVISQSAEPGPKNGAREWITAHLKDRQWQFNKVCESTHNYDMGSLYVEKNLWRIIGPTEAGPQKYGTGGEMALWESVNEGKTWTKMRNITEKSLQNHSYARRPLHAQKDFYAFWADGNADTFSASQLYFTNKKGNKVWVLPYDMDKAFAKPKRLR